MDIQVFSHRLVLPQTVKAISGRERHGYVELWRQDEMDVAQNFLILNFLIMTVFHSNLFYTRPGVKVSYCCSKINKSL